MKEQIKISRIHAREKSGKLKKLTGLKDYAQLFNITYYP